MATLAQESDVAGFGFSRGAVPPDGAAWPRMPACSKALEVVIFSAPGTG